MKKENKNILKLEWNDKELTFSKNINKEISVFMNYFYTFGFYCKNEKNLKALFKKILSLKDGDISLCLPIRLIYKNAFDSALVFGNCLVSTNEKGEELYFNFIDLSTTSNNNKRIYIDGVYFSLEKKEVKKLLSWLKS